MLQPKRTKFRKLHKGRIKGEAKGGSDLAFGHYGLKAIQPELLSTPGPKGLMNIQFAVRDEELYVIEVNPRVSRSSALALAEGATRT